MKAAMNGVLNLSVLDGWWDEAPHDEAGFVVGRGARTRLPDEEIAAALYDALEKRVLPMFFDRDASGLPQRWIDRMIVAASRVAREFSSDRMVSQYLEQCYVPGAFYRRAMKDGRPRAAEAARRVEGAPPRGLARSAFRERRSRSPIPRRCRRPRPSTWWRGWRSGRSTPAEVSRRALRGAARAGRHARVRHAPRGSRPSRAKGEIGVFRLRHRKPKAETLGYTVRVRPTHRDLAHPNETGPRPAGGAKSREARRYTPAHVTSSDAGRRVAPGILLHPDLAARPVRHRRSRARGSTGFSTGRSRRGRPSGRCCRSCPTGGGGVALRRRLGLRRKSAPDLARSFSCATDSCRSRAFEDLPALPKERVDFEAVIAVEGADPAAVLGALRVSRGPTRRATSSTRFAGRRSRRPG